MSEPPVFHHGPKPVSVLEFRDAVLAACPPRFPMARYARPRNAVLAVSGGVDSMALAVMFSQLLKTFRQLNIADNPASECMALVIDHKLREGSTEEAHEVSRELRRIGVRCIVRPINWRNEIKSGLDPTKMSNLESRARSLRYQVLGNNCRGQSSTNLFFAHHRDDQYETVLMRLLAGAGYRGLQGIRTANSIPECYSTHGVYKSGLIDDQLRKEPFLSFKPSNKVLRKLRRHFREEITPDYWKAPAPQQFFSGEFLDGKQQLPGHITREARWNAPYLTPLNVEDGGVYVYRPLLEFDKARLRATCEAYGVKWFEDNTNLDPTLTARNAIRHLVKNHDLPEALQKPAILALSERSKKRIDREEAEARRLLQREAVIQDFDPNAGTLLVELPSFRPSNGQQRRLFAEAREAARRPHRKVIAGIAARQLMDFVTPEHHLPSLANLDNIVHRLFPELFPERDPTPPSAFSIAGVLFDPLIGKSSIKWLLSRAPYPANRPALPLTLPGFVIFRDDFVPQDLTTEIVKRRGSWHSWKSCKLWDGRFWVHSKTCVAARFKMMAYQPEYGKAFRKMLTPKKRERLERLLRHYAPGKIRTTLPAIYGLDSPDGYPRDSTRTLLALPTLGIHVTGLERWLKYEVRYKNVDISLLGHRRRGDAAPLAGYRWRCSASRRKRRRRMRARVHGGRGGGRGS